MQSSNEQPISKRRNSEQLRGKQAWDNVRSIKDLDKSQEKKLEKEYRSLARGLNAMVQINGLGQTLGFLKAKGKGDEKKSHYLLLLHLTNWMQDTNHFRASNSAVMKEGYDGLLRWVVDPDTGSDDYRRATAECLAFGVWLRRFSEGELKEPEEGENINE